MAQCRKGMFHGGRGSCQEALVRVFTNQGFKDFPGYLN
jgi:hypothetical protein